LPKGTDFSIITDKEVAHIESLINNRPKKCLDSNYLNKKTPIEVASSFVALHG
jgi:IS30 family transposase